MKLNIGIAHPVVSAQSETFIRDHIRLLGENIVVLNDGYFPRLINGEEYLTLIEKLLLRIVRKLKTSGLESFGQSFRIKKLSRKLRSLRVDVLLAEYGPTAVACMPVCEQLGIPLVVHFHGMDAYDENLLNNYRADYIKVFNYASYIIVGTDDMFYQLVKLGASEKKLRKIPCGVNIPAHRRKNDNRDVTRYISVGRFVEKKGQIFTILAYAKIHEQLPNTELLLVGVGDLLNVCKQLVKALKLEKNVKFLGELSHKDTLEYLSQSDIYLQHSVKAIDGDSEGTSISVLEGAGSGLPVISTRHGGIQESVVHGVTGYLVDEYDVEGMSKYMLELGKNTSLAVDMGEKGRERVIEYYGINNSIGELRRALDDSVTSRNHG